jgi:Na+-driven multidrug efflux pump
MIILYILLVGLLYCFIASTFEKWMLKMSNNEDPELIKAIAYAWPFTIVFVLVTIPIYIINKYL